MDVSTEGYNNWVFMSTHFWDENPQGVWTLGLENKGYYFNTGEGGVGLWWAGQDRGGRGLALQPPPRGSGVSLGDPTAQGVPSGLLQENTHTVGVQSPGRWCAVTGTQ